MGQDSQANKWEGKATTKLEKATVEQIWPLFADFFNIHKYFPAIDTCHGVHGNNGEPGCVRYCRSSALVSSNDGDEAATAAVSWANERLVAADHDHHTLIYELLENNFGYKSYVATVKLFPGNHYDHDHDRPRGCLIEWSFTVDPVQGWNLNAMVSQIDECLRQISHKMEEEVLANLEQA